MKKYVLKCLLTLPLAALWAALGALAVRSPLRYASSGYLLGASGGPYKQAVIILLFFLIPFALWLKGSHVGQILLTVIIGAFFLGAVAGLLLFLASLGSYPGNGTLIGMIVCCVLYLPLAAVWFHVFLPPRKKGRKGPGSGSSDSYGFEKFYPPWKGVG